MFAPSRMILPALLIFVLIVPSLSAQDDKVFRSLTPDAVEKMLKDIKIEYKKSSAKKGDEHYYDFTRNHYRIRLTQFSAEEMMLDCVFRGISLDKVNQWNSVTRLTRASGF